MGTDRAVRWRIPFWAFMLLLFVLVVISLNILERLHLPVTVNYFWAQNHWFYIILYSLVMIICTTSLIILYKKPFDLTAKIFFIFLQFLAMAGNYNYLFINEPGIFLVNIAFMFSFNLYGVVLFHFSLIFPQAGTIYLKYKWLIKAAYLLGILYGIVLAAVQVIRYNYNFQIELPVFFVINRCSIAWMGLTLCAAFGMVIYQYPITKNIQVRKQLRLVLIGFVFGLVPPILFSLFPGYIRQMEPTRHLLTLFEFVNGTGTYIMTSFLAIAIFRHRIWKIEPFIRKAILYAGATVTIYFSYMALVFLADQFTSDYDSVIRSFILASLIIVFIFLRDNIQKFIDRFFHRESYNSVKVIKEFDTKFTGTYKFDVLKTGIVRFLNDILHFKSSALVVKISDSAYKPLALFGIENYSIDKEFEVSFELDKLLRKAEIFSVEDLKHKSKIIRYFQCELVIPLLNSDQLFGFLIIGPKLSGRSYSLQDIELLAVLSNRIVTLFQSATLYQNDLERQLLLEHERTRIAREMHDDVGASLTRISILSALLRNNCSCTGKTKLWLQQVTDTSREVIQDMNQIIWALNAKNDTLEGLIAFIRRFAFEYVEPSDVECAFNFPEHLPQMPLRVEIRRNIYLILREALNNVVKHARAGIVEIAINSVKDKLHISIRDNGIGFDAENKDYPGFGLLNMRKRMNDIGGEFELKSKAGEGTVIMLELPLNMQVEFSPDSKSYIN